MNDHHDQSTAAATPLAAPPPATLHDKARLTLHGLLEEIVSLTERANDGDPMAWDYAAAKGEELKNLLEHVAASTREQFRHADALGDKTRVRKAKVNEFLARHFTAFRAPQALRR